MPRGLMSFAVVSGVALGAWASWKCASPDFQLPSVVFLNADPHSVELAVPPPEAPAEANPAMLQASMAMVTPVVPSSEAGAGPGGELGEWRVSAQGMEAILEEMLRQGWKPPSGRAALASFPPAAGTPIEAIDPDKPVVPVVIESEKATGASG